MEELKQRDYLLPLSKTKIIANKNEEKTIEKVEKKEKKLKEMSDSRKRKFIKLFGQQIPSDETLINYFSCALVADILLQGQLYVSENYFSFYSNVFGYITKIIIPIGTVVQISKERTAKFFPNAIALQLSNGEKHIFGSFLSRESAYQLMNSFHKKTQQIIEEEEGVKDEVDGDDDVDDGQLQDDIISSIETSSISGSESSFKNPLESPISPDSPIIAQPSHRVVTTPPIIAPPEHQIGKYNVRLISEYNLLFLGICLTIILAIFSGLLLLKINSFEEQNHDDKVHGSKLSIEDAERILNKNVLIVQNVRKRLEELSLVLENSFHKTPLAQNQQEL